MDIHEILTAGGGAAAVVLTLLEVTPIKISPWSAIFRALGKAINQDLTDRVDKLGEKVDAVETGLRAMQDGVDQQNAICCRVRILRFGDEALHNIKHTQEHFNQILEDIRQYDAYCAEHPLFRNNVTVLTSQRIKEIYRERLEKNDFL